MRRGMVAMVTGVADGWRWLAQRIYRQNAAGSQPTTLGCNNRLNTPTPVRHRRKKAVHGNRMASSTR